MLQLVAPSQNKKKSGLTMDFQEAFSSLVLEIIQIVLATPLLIERIYRMTAWLGTDVERTLKMRRSHPNMVFVSVAPSAIQPDSCHRNGSLASAPCLMIRVVVTRRSGRAGDGVGL
jgi:hypothetical protein